MNKISFTCISISPADYPPTLAIAVARTDGIGLLDLEFLRDNRLAETHLKQLIQNVKPAEGVIGLRLPVERFNDYSDLLGLLSGREAVLLLCASDDRELCKTIDLFKKDPGHRLFVEVKSVETVKLLDDLILIDKLSGLVAKGHESGGWVGEDSSFILAQKHLRLQRLPDLPWYVQGGIGLHNAAGCCAMGAAGVVLDDQLLLMPESPLPKSWRKYLDSLNGKEAVALGERFSAPCRVLDRPGFQAVKELRNLADSLEADELPEEEKTKLWREQAGALLGWNRPHAGTPGATLKLGVRAAFDPQTHALPIGQGIGLAAFYRDHFKTTGKLIQAFLKTGEEHIHQAQSARSFHPASSSLAKSHGTTYPIVQGPMTRVSDGAPFAKTVADAGALPLLALALMRRPQVAELLKSTAELLGEKPWGVGILGFVPQELRDEQVEEILRVKPKFALIAGGRPDQATQLEKEGIATYLHAPTPELLRMFYENGSRRFVFEGRECGGHVGPLSSFLLWESAINTLLDLIPDNRSNGGRDSCTTSSAGHPEVHLLFAGGIHDASSALFVNVMTAPLQQRGVKIGLIMGTAYLFTREAVSSGAILKDFQIQALNCTRTVNLESGPGHASRCVKTPFTDEFYAKRRQLLREGKSAEEIRFALEELNLGRLRAATKGVMRDREGKLTEIDLKTRLREGMYMIGQLATLRHQVTTMKELHEEISLGSTSLLEKLQMHHPHESSMGVPPMERSMGVPPMERSMGVPPMESSMGVPPMTRTTRAGRPCYAGQNKPLDIAVIGIGALLPRAQNPQTYWENILKKINTIVEIPPHRWDWRLYYNPDRLAKDKIYSKWGGFLDDIPFDPLRFGIPPVSLKSIEPMQLLTLETVRLALEDAGYSNGDFDKEHTSVILGASGGAGDLGLEYGVRTELPRFIELLPEEAWDRLPEWTEETFAGILLNVLAGRVANRFDFGGTNLTVDAACASSLAALNIAVQELESGRSSLVITGGVDAQLSPFSYLCFCKTHALTPHDRARPFDKQGDGIVISEGLAMVVLKRLEEARRDGDRIYAVIKGMGSSSDGKAKGMTAPHPIGQMRALNRAYEKAGISPSTIGLIEAHGTGTVAGDVAETETIIKTLDAASTSKKSCAVGSVKAQIGHTKATAGTAGLVKIAFALYHKTLPPHINVEQPLDPLADENSPVYLLKEAHPWIRHPKFPRRAAVSAFGFGGTNFHAVLEEYNENTIPNPPGAVNHPCELFVFYAKDREELVKDIQALVKAFEDGARPAFRDLAYTCALEAKAKMKDSPAQLVVPGTQIGKIPAQLEVPGTPAKSQPNAAVRLSVVAENQEQLKESLEKVLVRLQGVRGDVIPAKAGIQENPPDVIPAKSGKTSPLGSDISLEIIDSAEKPKLAFLFPGQGSQYVEMAREAAIYLPELRESLESLDAQLEDKYPQRLSQYIYPPSAFNPEDEERNQGRLVDTHVAQASLAGIESGFFDFAMRLNLIPDMVCGHSIGEYSALYAAGVLSRDVFFDLVETRGRIMKSSASEQPGTMAAVKLPREQLEKYLSTCGSVSLANHNAPLQTVISGTVDGVKAVVDRLNSEGIAAKQLAVAGAFHSPLFASSQQPLVQAIEDAEIHPPKVPVYANFDGEPYPDDPEKIREQLCGHLLHSVEFVRQVKAMYRDGVRVFVELGPKNTLSSLVAQILEGEEFTALSFDGQGRGWRGLLRALGILAAKGVDFDLEALYQGRPVEPINLMRLAETTKPQPLSKTTWWVNGGGVRPKDSEITQTGKIPALNMDTSETAKKAFLASLTQTGYRLQATGYRLQASESENQILMSEAQSPKPEAQNLKPEAQNLKPEAWSLKPEKPEARNLKPNAYPVEALLAYQETMRRFLQLQEQVMAQFLSGQTIQASGVGQPESDVRQSVPEIEDSTKGSVSLRAGDPQAETPTLPTIFGTRENIKELVVNLVSERTGYPAEMLGLEQDMEADLGIDSIKRVEILGAVHRNLPEQFHPVLQENMGTFTRVKTLKAIIDQLGEIIAQASGIRLQATGYRHQATGYRLQASGSENQVLMSEAQNLKPDACPRCKMVAFPEPLNEKGTLPQSLEGLYLITRDQSAVSQLVAESLQKLGAQTALLTEEELKVPRLLAERVEQIRKEKGKVSGILHLAPLGEEALPETLEAWREKTQVHAKSLFTLLQLCADDLQKRNLPPLNPPVNGGSTEGLQKISSIPSFTEGKRGVIDGVKKGCVLAASMLGGSFGIETFPAQQVVQGTHPIAQSPEPEAQSLNNTDDSSSMSGLPTTGGMAGLLKTMIIEWQGVQAKLVDFSSQASPAEICQGIVDELLHADEGLEVGYLDGKRISVKVVRKELQNSDFPPLNPPVDGGIKGVVEKDWVVLVTGGARGITSEIALELAPIGLTFILVGRTPEPDQEDSRTSSITEAGELRKFLLEQAKTKGEHITPAQVEEQISRLLRDREIRRNIVRLRDTGATVEYLPVDVREERQVKKLLDYIYDHYGRLDAILHGAGIIEDKLIVDKQADSFDRVFDTKVDSAFLISRYVRPEMLKLLVFFTSLAGRFGNRGQADYAAANEVLNRFAWRLHREWRNTRILAINWGPWDYGMVTEEVKKQFRARGVIPIPVKAGRRFFSNELKYGSVEDVELIAGEGPWVERCE